MNGRKEARGRPGRREKVAGKPKVGTVTFRVRAGLKEKLEASAKLRELSLSEEVERRCMLSFDLALNPNNEYIIRTIANSLHLSELITGSSWDKDETTAVMAHTAMERAASLVLGFHHNSSIDHSHISFVQEIANISVARSLALYREMPIEQAMEIGKEKIMDFYLVQALKSWRSEAHSNAEQKACHDVDSSSSPQHEAEETSGNPMEVKSTRNHRKTAIAKS